MLIISCKPQYIIPPPIIKYFLMLSRPTFRINKLQSSPSKPKRLHSEGNKQLIETIFTPFEGEITSPTLRKWSPASPSSIRRNILKLKQHKSIKKLSNKDNRPYLQTQTQEVSLPSVPSLQIKSKSLKEQTNFTIIPVPIDPDFEQNPPQIQKQDLIVFPSHKNEFRKYSQNIQKQHQANVSESITFDIEAYNDVQKILQELLNQLVSCSVVGIARRYVEIISRGGLDNFYKIIKSQKQKQKSKIIQIFVKYERSIVLLVLVNFVLDRLEVNYNLVFSLLKCCLDSRILILSLIKKQIDRLKDIQQFQTPSYFNTQQVVKSSSAEIRNFEIVRANNQIIINLLQKLTIERNHFHDCLRRVLKDDNQEISKCFYRLLESFSFFLYSNDLEDKIPFLAIAPNPYLAIIHKYTLIIDIIDVMFDSESSCFRPHSQLFIQEMSKYYEIVSYSAKMPKEMEALIRFVDRKNNIKHKLYKQHFIKTKEGFKKDLSRIGRPLTEMLLVDVQECEQNPFNTFILKKWTGNSEDKSLEEVIYFLSSLPIKNANIQEAIRKHKEEESKKSMRPRRYSYWNVNGS